MDVLTTEALTLEALLGLLRGAIPAESPSPAVAAAITVFVVLSYLTSPVRRARDQMPRRRATPAYPARTAARPCSRPGKKSGHATSPGSARPGRPVRQILASCAWQPHCGHALH